MENSKEIPQKTKLELPYDPAIPFQGIYLKKDENTIWNDIYTPRFIAALCTIAIL